MDKGCDGADDFQIPTQHVSVDVMLSYLISEVDEMQRVVTIASPAGVFDVPVT